MSSDGRSAGVVMYVRTECELTIQTIRNFQCINVSNKTIIEAERRERHPLCVDLHQSQWQ